MEDCGEKSISNVKEIRNLKWKTKPKLKFFVWYLWLNPTITFLLLFSSFVMSDSWWPHGHLLSYPSHAKLPCPSQSPRVCSNSCSWSWWCHPNNSSSVAPFSSCPQSFFFFSALNLSPQQGLFQWVCWSHQVARELELQFQHQSFQWIFRVDWLV